jgi:hypothetical protein
MKEVASEKALPTAESHQPAAETKPPKEAAKATKLKVEETKKEKASISTPIKREEGKRPQSG